MTYATSQVFDDVLRGGLYRYIIITPHHIFISLPLPPLNNNFTILKLQPNKNVIFRCSRCFCIIFVLILYSLDTQVMLILILSDVQYSQKAIFSFEKGSNHQNHSSSGSDQLLKNSPTKRNF